MFSSSCDLESGFPEATLHLPKQVPLPRGKSLLNFCGSEKFRKIPPNSAKFRKNPQEICKNRKEICKIPQISTKTNLKACLFH